MTKTQAAFESLWRTVLQAGIGALVAYLGAQVVTSDNITSREWWTGLGAAVLSGVVAAVMRPFVPTATDHPGVAREDLAA
jgi:hypothetical protein